MAIYTSLACQYGARMVASLLLTMSLAALSTAVQAEANITILISSDAQPYQDALASFKQEIATQGEQINYRVYNAYGDAATATEMAQASNDGASTLTLCIGKFSCDALHQLPAYLTPKLSTLVSTEEDIGPASQGTGVYLNFLPETQLRQHAELFPRLTRVGVMYDAQRSGADIEIARATAQQLGLELIAVAVDSPRQLPTVLKKLLRQIDVLWALPEPSILSPQTAREMMLSSFRNRIPVIGSSASWTRSGALYSLERDFNDIGRQVATMAVQIIQGTSLLDVYPSEPRNVGFTLNSRTAKHMRIRLDSNLQSRAFEIFQ